MFKFPLSEGLELEILLQVLRCAFLLIGLCYCLVNFLYGSFFLCALFPRHPLLLLWKEVFESHVFSANYIIYEL